MRIWTFDSEFWWLSYFYAIRCQSFHSWADFVAMRNPQTCRKLWAIIESNKVEAITLPSISVTIPILPSLDAQPEKIEQICSIVNKQKKRAITNQSIPVLPSDDAECSWANKIQWENKISDSPATERTQKFRLKLNISFHSEFQFMINSILAGFQYQRQMKNIGVQLVRMQAACT